MPSESPTSTVTRFNAIQWHDSKLLGLSFRRVNSEDETAISAELQTDRNALEPARIVLLGCTYIELVVDLDGKRACADDISSAACYMDSDWTRNLKQQNPHDNFDGYLHFRITLIPPGGIINLLARDFEVVPDSESSNGKVHS